MKKQLLTLSSALLAVACTATDVDDDSLYTGTQPNDDDDDELEEPAEPEDTYTPSYDGNNYNVLFLMADDFNYWASCIGYYPDTKTPNIDALAQSGVLFSNAYCSSPVSNPSRNALWSGYRPSTTGIDTNSDGYIRDAAGFEDIVTMNQYFMQNGYYVYGGGKLYHSGSMGGDETDPENWSELNTSSTGSNASGGNYIEWENPGWTTMCYKVGNNDVSADNCNDYSLALDVAEFIDGYADSDNADKPFFIGCGFFRPHLPWNVSKQMYDLLEGGTFGIPQGYSDYDENNKGNDSHTQVVANNKWAEAIRVYLSCMALADYNVGVVMEALKSSPYYDNTIVVFVGDHGWHLGEKQNWGKNTIYNEANRTTLIIRYPGATESIAMTCEKPVSLQDLYPTLVDLCNLPQKAELEGTNITQLVMSPEYSQWYTPVLSTYSGTSYVQDEYYKYIETGHLYDLKNDPYEWTNLFGTSTTASAKVTEYQAKMDSIRAVGTAILATRGITRAPKAVGMTLTEADYPAQIVEAWSGKEFDGITFDKQRATMGIISHDMLCFEAVARLYLYDSKGNLIEESSVVGEMDLNYRIQSKIEKGTYYAVIEDGEHYTISQLNY